MSTLLTTADTGTEKALADITADSRTFQPLPHYSGVAYVDPADPSPPPWVRADVIARQVAAILPRHENV